MSPHQTSGIATVMFTDLEASTDTTTRLGDEAAAAFFATHDRIVREQFEDHGGRRVKSTGDGFLAIFDSPRSAVACALAIQRELAAQEHGPRVRIGINAGEVREDEGELFGAAINLAARVMDRAAGGEILVTETVRQLAGTIPGAQFRDRGRAALKGFPERQRLHQVRAAVVKPLPPPRPPRRRKRRRAPLVAAALVLAAGATAAVLASAGSERSADVRPDSVAIVDPGEMRVVGQVPVGVRPTDVVAGGGSVWVANNGDNTVSQIGARSRRVEETITPGISVDGVGFGPSGLWVADNERATARVIDPDFGNVAHTLRIGEEATQAHSVRPVAVTAGAVWISYGFGEIARVIPARNRIVKRFPTGNDPSAVAVGAGAVWVADSRDGTVTRIDPQTDEVVEQIPVGQGASGLAVGASGIWVAVPLEDRVKRINPATNAIEDTVRVDGAPAAVAIGAGSVWVTSRRGGTLTRIEPGTPPRVSGKIALGNSPQGVAVVDGAVWVALQARSAPASAAGDRRGVLTMLRPSTLVSIDPVVQFPPLEQVAYATCALLLNYPDEPFPAGARLHPEVARAMPDVSDGGRRYTFHLRPGFRFSPPSNAPVTAAAFRRAIERALHPAMGSGAPFYMGDVVGIDAYAAGDADHLAGVSASGDTLTIRLKAPSTTLSARLATNTFCAVPPNTPIEEGGVEKIPMAGPYYFASYVPKRSVVLRRNPNYGGSRPARFEEIDIDLDLSAARAWPAVEAGRADYVSAVPVESVGGLEQRYGAHSPAARTGGQRYFSGPAPVLHRLEFNPESALFARKQLRRAVSAALDRRAMAASLIFPLPAGVPGRPADQFTPPGLPGFRDAEIVPLGGPDRARARGLAGAEPHHVLLVTCDAPPCLNQARVVRQNLADIGFDVEIKAFSVRAYFSGAYTKTPWDIGYGNFFADYADPSNYVGDMATAEFVGERFARRVRAATRLPDAERFDAFARLDADLSRAATSFLPFATAVTTDFFSERIGCQVQQPIYGISLGALCIRD